MDRGFFCLDVGKLMIVILCRLGMIAVSAFGRCECLLKYCTLKYGPIEIGAGGKLVSLEAFWLPT